MKVLGEKSFDVDKDFKAGDEAAGVLVNGKYLKNLTAKNVKDMVRNPSGTLKLDGSSGLVNGKFMYVVDESGKLVVGTRAKGFNFSVTDGKAPHPTLIGGSNPTVKAAGIVEFRGCKIFKVDNASGHFKPPSSSLESAETIFKHNFRSNNFTNDF